MRSPRFKKWFAGLPASNQPSPPALARHRRSRRDVPARITEAVAPADAPAAPRRGISRDLDCVLVARDRSGQTFDAVTGRGALKACQPERHLLPLLDPQVLLVTSANAACRAFSRRHGIAHRTVDLRAGQRVRRGSEGAIHVQNVHSHHRRLHDWLMRFHGVASR